MPLGRYIFTPGNSKTGKDVKCWNLPVIRTCPGMSSFCRFCYAHDGSVAGNLRGGYFRYPSVRQRHEWNYQQSLKAAFVQLAVDELRRRRSINLVRLHSSGDFYSSRYIEKWTEIVTASPQVNFWAYTRSWRQKDGRLSAMLPYLERLAQLPNIQLWFSADMDTGLPPTVQNVRVAWLLTPGEQAPPRGADLVFPVKERGNKQKRITLPMVGSDAATAASIQVCPNYTTGITCEDCGICWRRPNP